MRHEDEKVRMGGREHEDEVRDEEKITYRDAHLRAFLDRAIKERKRPM